jgi:predicted transcriptional regulator
MDNTHHTLTPMAKLVLEFVQTKGKTTIREAADAQIGSYRNLQRVFSQLAKTGKIVGAEEGDRLKKFYRIVL